MNKIQKCLLLINVKLKIQKPKLNIQKLITKIQNQKSKNNNSKFNIKINN